MYRGKNKQVYNEQTAFCLENISLTNGFQEYKRVKTLMRCRILRHLISVFTVLCPIYGTLEAWERSGSVVECLTRDRGAAGSSLTGVTAL